LQTICFENLKFTIINQSLAGSAMTLSNLIQTI